MVNPAGYYVALVGLIAVLLSLSPWLRLRLLGDHRRHREAMDATARVATASGATVDQAVPEVVPSPARLRIASEEFVNDADLEVLTWGVSRERQAYVDRQLLSLLTAAAGAIVSVGGVILLSSVRDARSAYAEPFNLWHDLAFVFMATGTVIVAMAYLPYFSARAAYQARRKATASALVDQALEDACTGPDPLQTAALYRLNRRQLDEYQMQSKKQQRSAYALAQTASVGAFVVLAGGVVLTLTVEDDVDKYLSGGLTALGTLLSTFLASTFFRSADSANTQLNHYYKEPQSTGRMLTAERLVAKLGSGQDESWVRLIQALAESPTPTEEPATDKPVSSAT